MILLPTTWLVRTKTWPFTRSEKSFEQTGNPKEELPNEINSFAFALTGLVAEKDFQTAAVPVDFFYAKGILEALFTRLGLEVTLYSYD